MMFISLITPSSFQAASLAWQLGTSCPSAGTYGPARRLLLLPASALMSGYSYGHAERTLATIRLLETETRERLCRKEHLDPEQAEWLRAAAASASQRLHSCSASQLTQGPPGVR